MSDLREWLRANNLEQYAAAFEANDIDLDILSELDDRDLEQLGLSLGNRRRLLKAIAARSANTAPAPSDQTPPLSDKRSAAQESAPGDAERRQVTVMFADMVGSTALSPISAFPQPSRTRRSVPFAPRSASCRKSAKSKCPMARAFRRGSASPPVSSWSAKSSAPGWRRSGLLSAKRPTSPQGCRRSPARTASWSANPPRNCWAAFSNSLTPASMN